MSGGPSECSNLVPKIMPVLAQELPLRGQTRTDKLPLSSLCFFSDVLEFTLLSGYETLSGTRFYAEVSVLFLTIRWIKSSFHIYERSLKAILQSLKLRVSLGLSQEQLRVSAVVLLFLTPGIPFLETTTPHVPGYI